MHTTHYPKYGGQKYGTGQQCLAGWGYGGYRGFGAAANATSTAVTLASDFASDLQKQANDAKQASVAASATNDSVMASIMAAAGNVLQDQAGAVEAAAGEEKPPPPTPAPNWGAWAAVGIVGLGVWALVRRDR